MTPRFLVALFAAALFVLAGLSAFSEAVGGLRLSYVWLGFAAAAMAVAVGMSDRRQG